LFRATERREMMDDDTREEAIIEAIHRGDAFTNAATILADAEDRCPPEVMAGIREYVIPLLEGEADRSTMRAERDK
jgi:hypothetical protein